MDSGGPDVKSGSKQSYERFLAKAEGYLHKYQASHSAPGSASGPSPVTSGGGGGDRHIEFMKRAQDFLNKKDKKKKKDGEDHVDLGTANNPGDGQHNYKEQLKLAHAMLKKIKKHKGRHNKGKGSSYNNNNNEEEQVEEEEEIEEDEGGWFTEFLEGIQEFFEE